jgi:hypothetical protein
MEQQTKHAPKRNGSTKRIQQQTRNENVTTTTVERPNKNENERRNDHNQPNQQRAYNNQRKQPTTT